MILQSLFLISYLETKKQNTINVIFDKTIDIIKNILKVFDILFYDNGNPKHIDRIKTFDDIFYKSFIG